MEKIIESREKIYDNYLFYRKILPNNSLKCNLRPLEGYSPIYQKYPKSLFSNNNSPNNIKNKNNNKNNNNIVGNLIKNGKTIILTNNKKDLEKINRNNKPILINKKKLNDDNKINEEDNIYKKGFNKVYDINQIKQNSAFGGSKNFKSHSVQIYEYKNNLYLPSISQRLKYNKPRYDRESNQNDNFYNNNNIYL
jgi:hypothetical protein